MAWRLYHSHRASAVTRPGSGAVAVAVAVVQRWAWFATKVGDFNCLLTLTERLGLCQCSDIWSCWPVFSLRSHELAPTTCKVKL